MDFIMQMLGGVKLAFVGKTVLSLLLTTVLSSVIGLERERVSRPAGIRTHLLVGISSALVMLTAEYMYMIYPNTDPARLGAQVISGIGFLGAGTIIKEGYNVRGLTTAASLWSVACIGLAVGSGFYGGAILLTCIVYCVLHLFRLFFSKHSQAKILMVYLKDIDTYLDIILKRLEEYHLFIHRVEVLTPPRCKNRGLKITLSMPPELNSLDYILSKIREMDGVDEIILEA